MLGTDSAKYFVKISHHSFLDSLSQSWLLVAMIFLKNWKFCYFIVSEKTGENLNPPSVRVAAGAKQGWWWFMSRPGGSVFIILAPGLWQISIIGLQQILPHLHSHVGDQHKTGHGSAEVVLATRTDIKISFQHTMLLITHNTHGVPWQKYNFQVKGHKQHPTEERRSNVNNL